jgi:inorganic triphosphatase YgiF
MSHEIELKLTLPQKSLAALRRHPLIADALAKGAPAPSKTPISTP